MFQQEVSEYIKINDTIDHLELFPKSSKEYLFPIDAPLKQFDAIQSSVFEISQLDSDPLTRKLDSIDGLCIQGHSGNKTGSLLDLSQSNGSEIKSQSEDNLSSDIQVH